MVNIYLDMEIMETTDEAKRNLKEVMKLDQSFNGTPEALYEYLCEIGKPTHFNLANADGVPLDSPAYTSRLIQVFKDAAEQNPNVTIEIL